MSSLYSRPFLTRALSLDAAMSGVCAIALLAGAGWFTSLFGLPEALLIAVGAILMPYCIFLLVLAGRRYLPVPIVWTVILGNVFWVAASIALLLGNWFAPTVLGYAFVIGQAGAVGVFAVLQYIGLRRNAVGA